MMRLCGGLALGMTLLKAHNQLKQMQMRQGVVYPERANKAGKPRSIACQQVLDWGICTKHRQKQLLNMVLLGNGRWSWGCAVVLFYAAPVADNCVRHCRQQRFPAFFGHPLYNQEQATVAKPPREWLRVHLKPKRYRWWEQGVHHAVATGRSGVALFSVPAPLLYAPQPYRALNRERSHPFCCARYRCCPWLHRLLYRLLHPDGCAS